jgi:hypothetical protein
MEGKTLHPTGGDPGGWGAEYKENRHASRSLYGMETQNLHRCCVKFKVAGFTSPRGEVCAGGCGREGERN